MTCASDSTQNQWGAGTQRDPFILRRGNNFRVRTTMNNPQTGGRVDLTGRTGRAQLRRLATDQGPAVATFVVTTVSPATLGQADITLSGGASTLIPGTTMPPGLYVMDIEFVNDLDAADVIFGGEAWVRVVEGVTK